MEQLSDISQQLLNFSKENEVYVYESVNVKEISVKEFFIFLV